MRVNAVIVINIAGSNVRTVITIKIWIPKAYSVSPLGIGVLVSKGIVWALAGALRRVLVANLSLAEHIDVPKPLVPLAGANSDADDMRERRRAALDVHGASAARLNPG